VLTLRKVDLSQERREGELVRKSENFKSIENSFQQKFGGKEKTPRKIFFEKILFTKIQNFYLKNNLYL